MILSLSTVEAWAGFVACLLLILYSGARLSRNADLIAARTGLGGTWIGLVLVASVTSLPELVTGFSSLVVVHQPDLAVGAVFGSLIFNLLIIVVLDFMYRERSLYTRVHQGHVLSAAFGIVLIGIAAAAMMLNKQLAMPSLAHVGLFTPLAFLIYLLAVRSLFRYERRERAEYAAEAGQRVKERAYEAPTLAALYVRYAAHASVVVVTATVLPVIGEGLARGMGWDRTFVGTILLAFATSVPEIVISVAAVRIGAVDLAIGNVLGSNLFDMLILGIDDLIYLPGPLLGAASDEHMFTAIGALTMTGIVIVGLMYRPERRVLRLVGWISLALVTLAVLNAVVLLLFG